MVTSKAKAFLCPRHPRTYSNICYGCTCGGRRTQGIGRLEGQAESTIEKVETTAVGFYLRTIGFSLSREVDTAVLRGQIEKATLGITSGDELTNEQKERALAELEKE